MQPRPFLHRSGYGSTLAAPENHFSCKQTLPYAQLHMYGQQASATTHCIRPGVDHLIQILLRSLSQPIWRVFTRSVLLVPLFKWTVTCIFPWGFAYSHCFPILTQRLCETLSGMFSQYIFLWITCEAFKRDPVASKAETVVL